MERDRLTHAQCQRNETYSKGDVGIDRKDNVVADMQTNRKEIRSETLLAIVRMNGVASSILLKVQADE